MNRLIIKIFLFVLPVLLVAASMELLIRQIPNDYSYKRNYLDENSNNIEILFLGSSHTYYGIDPDYISGNVFNASHISQSIDYDYEILLKYENNWNHLRYLFIPIDYPTLYTRLSTGMESWRVKNYSIYYNIQQSISLSENSELLSLNPITSLKRIYAYYINNESSITCSKLGYGNSIRKLQDLESTGNYAAIRHANMDMRCFEESIDIIEKLIDFTSNIGVKIIFYTSPSYHTYVTNLDEIQLNMTISTMNDIAKINPNCSYFNFLEDNSFNIEDFWDADHLNIHGARKFSMKLNEILSDI